MQARTLDPSERVVVASHNPGKVREIDALLQPYTLEIVGADTLGLPEPEETGDTFRDNAELKARAATAGSGLVALADDSGLVVPALGGAPGIYSARWAGPGRDFAVAMARIDQELQAAGFRTEGTEAYFICVLSLCWPDGHCESFEGRVDGMLTYPPLGERGFGYDPMFVPGGHALTFGEMLPSTKDAMTHRARAFEKLAAACLPPLG